MELSRERIRALLPERPQQSHKGTFGHLFVLAGSRGFTGAAKLACEAAGRSGVGLVTLGIPQSLSDVFGASLREAMSVSLPGTYAWSLSLNALEMALEFAADKQAVVVGPGLSRYPDTVAFAQQFISRCPVPMVVDADALNALSECPEILTVLQAPCILTPHPGEMARLTGKTTAEVQEDRENCARQVAGQWQCVVVLKGHRTVIAGPDGEWAINTTGNNGLAKGGTGDVLAGLLGGLLAQGMAPFDAACAGVFVHGLAGDLAAARFTARGMVAGDLIDLLPEAWRAVEG